MTLSSQKPTHVRAASTQLGQKPGFRPMDSIFSEPLLLSQLLESQQPIRQHFPSSVVPTAS